MSEHDLRRGIVDAAMRLAARDGWREAGLDAIAAEAGVGLDVLRRHYTSRADILADFTRLIDDAVLQSLTVEDRAGNRRDRLFDVLMTRFEKLAPYKAAVKRIAADDGFSLGAALAQLGPALHSQRWMLTAAGVPVEGVRGVVRVKAMTAIYARVFRIWLEDDDPGLARTMAALDRALRRAEGWSHSARRFRDAADVAMAAFRNRTARAARPSPPSTDAPAEPTPSQI
jgi:AcrR family transcriptional regulator